MNRLIIKIAIFLTLTTIVQSQTLLLKIDFTDVSKRTIVNGKFASVQAEGTMATTYSQNDTTKRPILKEGINGAYFTGTQTLYSSTLNTNLPNSWTAFIVSQRLGNHDGLAPIISEANTDMGFYFWRKFGGLSMYKFPIDYYTDDRSDAKEGFKLINHIQLKNDSLFNIYSNNGLVGGNKVFFVKFDNSWKPNIIGQFQSYILNLYALYEIRFYEGFLDSAQIWQISKELADKHNLPYYVPAPQTPSSTHMSGSGLTPGDPKLIYDIYDLDSIRYMSNVSYIKLMDDIDFGGVRTFEPIQIPTNINIDGNHKTIKNYYMGYNGTGANYLIRNTTNSIPVIVKNLKFYNIFDLSVGSAGGQNSFFSLLYRYDNLVQADSIIIERAEIGSAGTSSGAGEITVSLIGKLTNSKRIALRNTFLVITHKMNSNAYFEIVDSLNQLSIDNSNFLHMQTSGAVAEKRFFNISLNGRIKNWMISAAKSMVVYDYNDETQNDFMVSYLSFPISVSGGEILNNILLLPKIARTTKTKTNTSLSLRAWDDDTKNLSSVVIDTTYNLGYLYYPTNTYSGNKPSLFSTSQAKTKSDFESLGFDFVNIWGIDSLRNEGRPYLLFAPPKSAKPIDIISPNSQLTFFGGQTINVYYSSVYDTNKVYLRYNNQNYFKGIALGSSSTFNFQAPYGLNVEAKIIITNKDSTDYDETDTTFFITRTDSMSILYPTYLSEFVSGDTLTMIFKADRDFIKVYFRENPTSAWEYLSTIAVSNYQDTARIVYRSNAFSTQAKLMITSLDSSILAISEDFITKPDKFIKILSPSPNSASIEGGRLKIQVESRGINNYNLYYKTVSDTNYKYVLTNTFQNGSGTDTTIIYFDYMNYSLSNPTTIRIQSGQGDGTITGSLDTAYYPNSALSFAGLRSPQVQFQSVQKFSKIFQYNDSLYTITYYAYAYGWYDYHDRIEVYKFNDSTNRFVKILSLGQPNSAYYPSFNFFRTNNINPFQAILTNNIYYKTTFINLSNKTISPFSPQQFAYFNDIPSNIDKEPTLTVVKNFWKYEVIDRKKIFATDLLNSGNTFLLFDISNNYQSLKAGRLELADGIDKIFITNHIYSGEGSLDTSPSATYFFYPLPLNDKMLFDEAEVNLLYQRNFFRGIYPKAILKVIPKL